MNKAGLGITAKWQLGEFDDSTKTMASLAAGNPPPLSYLGRWQHPDLAARDAETLIVAIDNVQQSGALRAEHRILEVDDLLRATSQRIVEAGIDSVETLQMQPRNVIGASSELAAENRELKSYLFQNMYKHYRVARMEAKADRVLTELFNTYIGRPEQLPPAVRERADDDVDRLYRAVCDYLAGMTDRFALDEHARLFDPYTLP